MTDRENQWSDLFPRKTTLMSKIPSGEGQKLAAQDNTSTSQTNKTRRSGRSPECSRITREYLLHWNGWLKAAAHVDDLVVEARVELAVAPARTVVEVERIADLKRGQQSKYICVKTFQVIPVGDYSLPALDPVFEFWKFLKRRIQVQMYDCDRPL